MTRIGDRYQRPLPGPTSAAGPSRHNLLATQVQAGETMLSQVAERLQTLLDLLQKLNPQISDPNRLRTGQEIFYPAPAGLTQPAPSQSSPPAPADAGRRSMENRIESAIGRSQLADRASTGGTVERKPVIPPFNPALGPQITKVMWTEEMMTTELTEDMLRNIVDPADFLNARLEYSRKPTTAHWVDNLTGATQVVNSSHLSTKQQAEAMLARLRALGYSGEGVVERRPENPFSRIVYGDETRRHWYIGDMSVGLLLERYAKHPKEAADAMTLAEIRQGRG